MESRCQRPAKRKGNKGETEQAFALIDPKVLKSSPAKHALEPNSNPTRQPHPKRQWLLLKPYLKGAATPGVNHWAKA